MRIPKYLCPHLLKKSTMAYVGEIRRKLADPLREHLNDIHNETPKPVFLHFNNWDQRGEDISVTALNSCTTGQINRQTMENCLI